MRFPTGLRWGLLLLLLAGPGRAQDLTGQWQGVELTPGAQSAAYWPWQLTLRGTAGQLTGSLFQVDSNEPQYKATYRIRGTYAPTGTGATLRLTHVSILTQTNPDDASWCQGTMTLTYDAAQNKLTGRSAYTTRGCRGGQLELYRVQLKSARTVPAGQLSTLRVSGRNVRWFADAALRRPLASGNTYRTRLRRTTTFYITQGFYPTAQSPVVPVTVRVAEPALAARAAPAAAPLPPAPAPKPLVLAAVLFKQGTAELLPESQAALAQLAAHLQANPGLRVRVAGHTDRIGEADKNQLLSEQRAAAVKEQLVQKHGVAAGRVETIGYGHTRLLHPAPDLRNRRVEVTFLP